MLKKLKKELRQILDKIGTLEAKETRTADEQNELRGLIEQGEGLQKQIEIAKRSDELKGWAGSETDEEPVIEGEHKGGRKPGERVGTDLITLEMNGAPRLLDWEGFGVSEATFRAISEPTYAKAYGKMLRGKADAAELKTLQAGTDEQGGFLAPPQWIASMIGRKAAESSLLDLVGQINLTGGSALMPKENYTGGDNDTNGDIFTSPYRKRRTGETGDPHSEDTPSFGTVEIGVYEGSLEVPLTRTLAEDGGVDIENWVRSKLSEAYRLDTERELAVGTGINCPAGIMRNPGGANEVPTVNIGNPVTGDGLIDLYYTLPRQYRMNGVAVMEDSNAYRTLAKIQDDAGAYIFGLKQTTDGGLMTPRGESFLGKPIAFNPFYSTGGAAANLISWGDHRSAYYYALRLGMSVQVQNLPRDPFLYVVLRFRDGGKLVQPRALRVGKQS